MNQTILEFCNRHDACTDVRYWALTQGVATMAELWERADMRPVWRVWIATRPGVMSDRDLRLYACWCVRQVWHLLPDDRSRNAVEVEERFAVGETTAEELAAARADAWGAYADARAVAEAAADDARSAWAAYTDARAAARLVAAWAKYADVRAADARAAASRATASRAAARASDVIATDAAYVADDVVDAIATNAAYDAAVDARAAQSAYLVAQGNPFKEIVK